MHTSGKHDHAQHRKLTPAHLTPTAYKIAHPKSMDFFHASKQMQKRFEQLSTAKNSLLRT
jgi:hypothetical protein